MDRRRSLILTVVAAMLAIGIGVALSYAIHWFPVEASSQAKNTDRLYHVLVDACIPIFVLVTTVVLYCAWQFHMKPGEELKDGPPIHGNTRLEVFWTATPARLGTYPIVCNLLCGLGHSLMRTSVHVVTPAAFAAWLKSQRATSTAGGAAATASSGTAAARASG